MFIYHGISEETIFGHCDLTSSLKLKVGHPDLITVKMDSFEV